MRSRATYFCGDYLSIGDFEIGNHNTRTFLRETATERGPNAIGATSDDDNFIFEFHRLFVFPQFDFGDGFAVNFVWPVG